MRDKLREILEYFNSVGNKGSGDIDYAVDEILDLLDKSLPGSKPFEKGYNQAIADVRKVIKEDKMSNCCNAQVYDPSGLGIEGRCKDCLEMCLIVKEAE